MIKNYFKLAWRNLEKNKVFSAINILGLSIGLACCILMFLFIQRELSYDKFNANAKNTYRVTSIPKNDKDRKSLAVTPAPWVPLMKKDYPQIEEFVRLLKAEKTIVGQPGGEHFYEKDVLYADSTFFNVFSIALERGDIKTALERPNSILLTSTAAHKFFGDTDPIGKTLEINSFGRTLTVEVTAIVAEAPATSHFSYSSIVSMPTLGDISNFWSFHMFQSYLVLSHQASADGMETKLREFADKYIANNPQADGNQEIHLQPLTRIHLYSGMIGEIGINGDITYIYVFSIVAIFILLIACFNFTNLSTARSMSRAREVGLRKVVGAGRIQLMKQFLGETAFFATIALLIAIAIVVLTLPLFNQLSGRQLSLELDRNYPLVILMLGLVIFTGIIAGLYPATILSAFKPVEILRGRFIKTNKGISFRKVLVTLQFVVSIGLIAGTILINKQLHFLQNKKLGFDKQNVFVLTLPRNADSAKLETFRNLLASNRGIRSLGAASSLPGPVIAVNQVNDGDADLSKAVSMQMLFTDNDFVHTMNMQLVAGRDFSRNYATDASEAFILNEEAVKKMGWASPAAAIGKPFQWVTPTEVSKSGKVIGVVKDFNITPLKSAIQPLVMHILPQRAQYLYIRFDQLRADDLVATAEKAFHHVFSNQSFEYSFLDDSLASMYNNEKKLGSIFSCFSLLAIVIACLGVLGLSLYSIQRRIKEIGVRKVLGASVPVITGLLIKEFAKPILLATIIAAPIIWYGVNKWLDGFAYRIEISWWIFPVSGIIALMIAILTVCVQAIKAALANPVNSLRTE